MGEVKEEVRRLMCQLTEEEYQSKSKELSRLIREKAAHEDQRRASAQHYKELIDNTQKNIEDILPVVESGEEERPVHCRIEFNVPEKGLKTVTRLDTGEKVETCDMTDEEAADMFYNADDPESAAANAVIEVKALPEPAEEQNETKTNKKQKAKG